MASSKDSFVKYICSGPLLKVCGITAEDVQRELETWERLGRRLAVQLKFDYANMDDIQRLRIYHYYLPVALWVHKQYQQHLQRHAGTTPPPAMVVSKDAETSSKKHIELNIYTIFIVIPGICSIPVVACASMQRTSISS